MLHLEAISTHQNEFYNLGNIMESDTRQRGIMSSKFFE
jgi:hypothetical protein